MLYAAVALLCFCDVARAEPLPAPLAQSNSNALGSAATITSRLAQPVTADFQEVDFASAIAFLSDSAGVNILVSEKAKQLTKPVTVHLVGMPLNRALEYLVRGQGLLYRLDDQAIWIATRDEMEGEPLETRVFFLNQGAGLFAAFQPLTDTHDSVALQSNSVKGIKTIKDILLGVIPEVSGSSLMLDEKSGALIVTHVPYYLQQIEQLLSQLDLTPVQILIEARFIETTVTDTNEWGVDGQLTGNAALTKTTDRDGRTKSPGLQLSAPVPALKKIGTQTSFTDFANQTSGNALNLNLQGILTGTQYSAVLHALAENKKTKTLSAPRVTTLNNQTATIKIVKEFVYATKYQPTVVREDGDKDGKFDKAGETRFVNVPQDFVTKDLGIVLYVTPSVGQDLRTISLALKPEVSELKTTDTFGGEVSLPRFTTRNLETTVVIENGQTVILGGLMKDVTVKTVTKLPVLGSLPLVGKLFRKENETAERSNLLIFVTAQLVDPSGATLAKVAVR